MTEGMPFYGATVVEVSIPSGRVIAADDLRRVPHFSVEPPESINCGAGRDAWTRLYAEQAQVAQAFVGNTCPSVIRSGDGSFAVISPEYDDGTDEAMLADGETTASSKPSHTSDPRWTNAERTREQWNSSNTPATYSPAPPQR